MNKRYPKISVIIITYNQEKLISRAIDSVINQKDYLHELIISDDCSQDKTWDIVKKYKEKFSDKIKVQRHIKNLGIYENLESTYHLVTGEIIFYLSGDDAMGENLLKSTCEFLANKNVNYEKDRLCVITDYKVIFPNGLEEVRRNNALIKKYDPFALKLREIVVNRALGETRAIFEIRRKINISKLKLDGHFSSIQERLFDNLPFYYAEKIYHIPIIGNIYYAKIGISKELAKKRKQVLLSNIEALEKIPKYYDKLNVYDMKWLNFQKIKFKSLLYPDIKNYFEYLYKLLILINDPFKKFFIFKEIKHFIKYLIKNF